MSKVKPGSNIYVVTSSLRQIVEEQVGYIGEHSFVIKNYNLVQEHYREYNFEDKNIRWFSTLEKAKTYVRQKLKSQTNRNRIIFLLQTDSRGDYWEVIL